MAIYVSSISSSDKSMSGISQTISTITSIAKTAIQISGISFSFTLVDTVVSIGTIGVSLSGEMISTGSNNSGLISRDNSSIVMVDKASSNSGGKDSSSQGVSMAISISMSISGISQ